MALELKAWNTAEFIRDEEDLAAYLSVALNENELPKMYGHALALACRVRGGVAATALETQIPEIELQRAIDMDDERSAPTLLQVQQAYQRLASSGRHAA